LTNGRGVFRDSLAEFAIGAMLFFAKDLRRMVRNQEAGRWDQFDIEMLDGQTLGIVGYGEIGRATARLARAFNLRILAVRRRAALSENDPNLDSVYAPEQLEEMLAASDFVLVAAPNTPETRGMIGEPELNVMKNSAVIINVGRGPVIVESALVQALENKRIRGAALDVFDHEPLPEGHPFYSLDNVLLSPHCADHTVGWVELAVDMFVENFRRFQDGQPLHNIVDKKAGY
jgi:phosphoglycerate dehydrogenase-like enzyme